MNSLQRKIEIYDELMKTMEKIAQKRTTAGAKISMASNAARHAYLQHKGERK